MAQNTRTYEVIVGNVGRVHTGSNYNLAAAQFADYVAISKVGRGRAGGEDVTLMRDGDVVRSFDYDLWVLHKGSSQASADMGYGFKGSIQSMVMAATKANAGQSASRADCPVNRAEDGAGVPQAGALTSRFDADCLDVDADGSEAVSIMTYSLAEVRNGTGWPKGVRFIMIEV